MLETVFQLTRGEEKTIEKVVMDENLHYMHMILPQGQGLPEHDTNSNVYMTVLRGTLSIALGDQEMQTYEVGTLLRIPFRTRMNVKNLHPETLEITVVKAPAPQV